MVSEIESAESLLTPAQVAERLGLTEQTLAHWRCTGRVNLPYVSMSRRCVRYRAEDVERFIQERLVSHTGESAE